MLVEELNVRKRAYVTVYQQAISPCGRYLAACDSFGRVSVFQLAAAVSANTVEDSRKPLYHFQAYDNLPCYTIITVGDDFLITGGQGPVKAFSWKDIARKCKLPSAERLASDVLHEVWSLSLEVKKDLFDEPECNCLMYDEFNGTLYAAGGNDLVQRWDLEGGRGARGHLQGHSDYVQWISSGGKDSGQTIASASEDGSAKVWDIRTGSAVKTFFPGKRRELARPEFGSWLSCVALDSSSQWLVCGGGPFLSIWHVPSGEMTQAVEIPGATQHFVSCDKMSGEISVGSSDNHLYTTSINGAITRKVSCNVPVVYDILKNDRITHLITACGQSSKIDVLTNPGYIAFSLSIRN